MDQETQKQRDPGRLLRRLQKRSRLRMIAQHLLEGEKDLPPPETPAVLMAILHERGVKQEERAAAAWALGEIPLDPYQRVHAAKALEEILESLRPEAQPVYKQIFQTAAWAVGIVPGIAFVLVALNLLVYSSQLQIPAICWWLLVILVYIPIRSARETVRGKKDLIAFAATTLGSLEQKSSLPALWGWRHLAETSLALQRILPLLTEDDYGRLDPRTMQVLYCLAENGPEPFALQALAALAKMGGGDAVPVVQRVVRRGATARLQQAAREILPILYSRRQREKSSLTLLRASAAPGVSSGQLLRAAGAPPEAPPEQLLRSINREGPSP